MKKYAIEAIRNVGLFGHQGSGKTSLAEAMLYTSGAIDRMGRTEEGNATTDFDPEESRRHISINVGLAPCEWGAVHREDPHTGAGRPLDDPWEIRRPHVDVVADGGNDAMRSSECGGVGHRSTSYWRYARSKRSVR